MGRTNPPYDGKECPMCSQTIRGAAALLHNFLVRWPENNAWVKLNDLKQFYLDGKIDLKRDWFDHPVTNEFYSLLGKLEDALRDITQDEKYIIRWTPETTAKVTALIPECQEMARKLDMLSETHFDDARHSHGHENVLYPENSSRRIPFLPDYDRNYTVEAVATGGDYMHTECGTRIKLHQYFKDKITADPTFYAKMRCPHCRDNVPFVQLTKL